MIAAAARRGLDACDRALALQLCEAVQRFGAAAPSIIDLPPVSGGRIDAGALHVASVLAWAWEVEQAGMPSFVEALAEGVMNGTLLLPIETGGERLGRYWRARHERFTADERRELYARIFGEPAVAAEAADGADAGGSPFPALFEALVEALIEIGRAPTTRPLIDLVVRANAAARDLAADLSMRAVGMAAYAARDIVAHVRLALSLVGATDIARALGTTDVWRAIELHGPEVLGRQLSPRPHLARAEALHAVISWLADQAGSIGALSARIGPADAVVRAAESWQAERVPP